MIPLRGEWTHDPEGQKWAWSKYTVEYVPGVVNSTETKKPYWTARVGGSAFIHRYDLIEAMACCENHRVRELSRKRNQLSMELDAIEREIDYLNEVTETEGA